MRRRALLLAAPLALAGCGLSERPYAEQREWPFRVQRPTALPPRADGPVLEVRGLRAGPGLEDRGLQSLRADGSIRTAFYEQWAVPPADGAEDALRLWLAQCGKFAAVVAPGSRAATDLSLDGELTLLWTDGAVARAAVAATVVAMRAPGRRIVLQQTFEGTAPVADGSPAAAAHAQLAALGAVFAQIETALTRG
jgi:ABC-type uncharacterized transport system auxiliary subunit